MMNMDLAAMYGTPGGPSEEDLEKTAQMELFVKLAAENNIDLSQYTDDEVAQLWDETFKGAQEGEGEGEKKPKKNGEDEEEEEEEQEKESAALAEFAEQQEWQEKVAEMDYLGRLMAHSYVNELNEIGEAMDKEAGKVSELYGAAKSAIKGLPGKAGEKAREYAGRAAGSRAGKAVDVHLQSVGGRASRATAGLRKRLGMKTEFAGEGKARRIGAGVYGGGAALAGGGGYAGHRAYKKKKQSSAIDEYALELALQKVAEANWDTDEAVERLNALYTLDAVPESEKIAAASDINEAIEARSLELLEAAGYPVEWNY